MSCSSRAIRASLLRDRDACGRLALAFGLRRADLGRLRLLRTVAEDEPRGPADAEVDRDDDQLGRQVAGDVVDDRDDPSEDDREPGPGPPEIALVPEQEGGDQSDRKEADHERDERPVDERDGRRDQPVGGGRREGKPPAGEERGHQQGHQRNGVADRHGRRVPAQDQLEHGRDQKRPDQQLVRVLAGEGFDPAHALKVLHALTRRLLPE